MGNTLGARPTMLASYALFGRVNTSFSSLIIRTARNTPSPLLCLATAAGIREWLVDEPFFQTGHRELRPFFWGGGASCHVHCTSIIGSDFRLSSMQYPIELCGLQMLDAKHHDVTVALGLNRHADMGSI